MSECEVCMQVCETCERAIVAARMAPVMMYLQGRILRCDEEAKSAEIPRSVEAIREREVLANVLAMIRSEGPRENLADAFPAWKAGNALELESERCAKACGLSGHPFHVCLLKRGHTGPCEWYGCGGEK